MSLRDVYDIKFRELSNCVDEVDKNLYNLREAWEEMRPDRFAENEDKSDKDLFGNVVLGRRWMLVSELDRMVILMEEISILKSRIQPEDTGHLHTTISTLESRVLEIKEKLQGAS